MKVVFLANKYSVLADTVIGISCRLIELDYVAKNGAHPLFQLICLRQTPRSETRNSAPFGAFQLIHLPGPSSRAGSSSRS